MGFLPSFPTLVSLHFGYDVHFWAPQHRTQLDWSESTRGQQDKDRLREKTLFSLKNIRADTFCCLQQSYRRVEKRLFSEMHGGRRQETTETSCNMENSN